MPGRRRLRFAAGLGVVWLAVPLVLFFLERDVYLAGHPAHVVSLAVAGLVGLVLLVVVRGDGRRSDRRGAVGSRPGVRWGLVVGRTLGVLVSAVVLGALVWLQPFPAKAPAAAVVQPNGSMRVTDAPTRILITPLGPPPDRALVFQPGARVDPRAYVPVLTEVSRRGFLVVIVKQPFDLALLATGAPRDVIDRHPEVRHWAVGGHSLGGVAAAEYAAEQRERVDGLVLWASYPVGTLAARSDLAVVSVSGSLDRLTTPADVAARRAKLPASTTYTVIEGAVHSSFGDYGPQPGDGTPTVDHAAAQQQIVDATVALLQRM